MMFLIEKGKSSSLHDIAVIHANNLIRKKNNYKGKGMPYETDSIIRRVEKVYAASNGKVNVFVSDLRANDYALLKQLLIAQPNNLNRISNVIQKKISNKIYPEIRYRQNNASQKLFGDYLNYIFNYDVFVDKESFWNAYELSSKLDVSVCSYCNRNYTYTVHEGRNYYVRPEFDHFLPKSEFPYLAISFYNLIPSCHICNSNLKRDIPFTLKHYLHPYMENFDDVLRFTVSFISEKGLTAEEIKTKFGIMFFSNKTESFNLKLVKKSASVSNYLAQKAINNAGVFKIIDLYNCHKDLVTEMVVNTIIYDEAKINELLTSYNGRLFNSKDDVLRHITNNFHSGTGMQKRPFSKLSKDIHLEFGLKY
jgi:hypothetical protein